MKRISALLLTLMMLVSLAACQSEPKPELGRATNVYSTQPLEIPEGFKPTDFIHASADGYSTIVTKSYDSGAEPDECRLLEFDSDGKLISTAEIPLPDGIDVRIRQAAIGEDAVYFFDQSFDSQSRQIVYRLCKSSGGKTELLCEDPSTLFKAYDDNNRDTFRPVGILVDSDGELWLFTENSVAVFDKELNKIGELIHEYEFGTAIDAGERGAVLTLRELGNRGMVTHRYYLDKQNLALGNEIELPPQFDTDKSELLFDSNFGMYINNISAIYGFTETESTVLCNFINSDLNPHRIAACTIKSADEMLAYTTDTNELLLMKRIPDEEVPLHEIIRLVDLSGNQNIIMHVLKFNRENEQYRLIHDDYSGTEDAREALKSDMLAGKLPDILCSTGLGSDFDTYMGNGIFTDLLPLMKADKAFDPDSFLPCVTTNATQGGKLTELMTIFELRTIAIKQRNMSEPSWTVDAYLDYAESRPDGELAIWMFEPEVMFDSFTDYSLGEWIDYENRTCDFTKPSFVRLLNFCASLPSAEEFIAKLTELELAEVLSDPLRAYREDVVLAMPESIDSFTDIMELEFLFGDSLNFIGYPSGGAYISRLESFAVTEQCASKAGAWLFIKQLATETLSVSTYGNHYLYASTAKNEAAIERSLSLRYFFDTNRGSLNIAYTDSAALNYEKSGKPEVKLTRELAERVYTLLENTTIERPRGNLIAEVIREEADYFFAGEKSADEVARVIQDRVSIILAEQ